MSPFPALGLDVLVLSVWGVATGAAVARIRVVRSVGVTPREAEIYRRILRVRRWQSHLPEAGPFDKRRLGGPSTERLERYAAEARRAEVVHGLGLVIVPVLALWNPATLMVAMVIYGVGANVPCLVSVRYNRFRIDRIVRARAERAH